LVIFLKLQRKKNSSLSQNQEHDFIRNKENMHLGHQMKVVVVVVVIVSKFLSVSSEALLLDSESDLLSLTDWASPSDYGIFSSSCPCTLLASTTTSGDYVTNSAVTTSIENSWKQRADYLMELLRTGILKGMELL
jgi:hypothetical protein